jgi:hypothetical protein
MSPRKKSKPNPTAPADTADHAATPSEPAPDAPDGRQVEPAPAADAPPNPSAPAEATLQKKASRTWLGGGGSWRSKATATVKTAKESIGVSVSGGAASELPSRDTTNTKDQSPAKFLTKRKSSKGDAIPAAMTRLHVSSDGAVDKIPDAKPQEPPAPRVDEPPLPPEPPRISEPSEDTGAWGWRSWWSRPDGYAEQPKTKDGGQSIQDAQKTPLPGATPSEEPTADAKELGTGIPPEQTLTSDAADTKTAPPETAPSEDTEMKDTPGVSEAAHKHTPSASWFWSWTRAQNAQANLPPTPPTSNDTIAEGEPLSDPLSGTQDSAQPEVAVEPPLAPVANELESKDTAKSSGWAFWYRDKPKTDGKTEEGPNKHVGEVAVSDTPSQSRPEPAQFNEQEQSTDGAVKGDAPKEAPPKEAPPPVVEEPAGKRSFRSLRGRPKTKSTPKDSPSSSKAATPTKTSPAPSPTRPETAPASQSGSKLAARPKIEPPNIILPEFQHTYRMVQQPSFWQQIRHYFLGEESAMPHLHINPAPPRIKKAVAIGVHGYFPAPIFQKVIGQPKGTSIRFANAAAASINDWCEAKGYTPEIEQIALEGEGFIADRVKTLWKLLLNWIEHIKAADFILVACHSQGVPVAIMLVAKLIQFGCVNATRIGICAMAGVNMGPFIEYRTKYFGPTAAELFEFSNPKSLVSQMYLASLDEVLRFGVRVTYIGSIDDQLVSLEVRISFDSAVTAKR